MPELSAKFVTKLDRRSFIGGSDARIIMGRDEVRSGAMLGRRIFRGT